MKTTVQNANRNAPPGKQGGTPAQNTQPAGAQTPRINSKSSRSDELDKFLTTLSNNVDMKVNQTWAGQIHYFLQRADSDSSDDRDLARDLLANLQYRNDEIGLHVRHLLSTAAAAWWQENPQGLSRLGHDFTTDNFQLENAHSAHNAPLKVVVLGFPLKESDNDDILAQIQKEISAIPIGQSLGLQLNIAKKMATMTPTGLRE